MKKISDAEIKRNYYYYNTTNKGTSKNSSFVYKKRINNKLLENDYLTNSQPTLIGLGNYFNHSGVLSTYMKVDFYAGKDSNGNDIYNSIDNVHNNYIVSMSTEDEGGAQRLTLELFDKNFTVLNDYINTAIKEGQPDTGESVSTTNVASNTDTETGDTSNYINIVKNKSNAMMVANIRVRFGYSDNNQKVTSNYAKTYGYDDEQDNRWHDNISQISYENTTEGASEVFEEKNQTTIRSPVYDYFITGLKSAITSDGIHFTVSAIEMSAVELYNYKIVQRYALLKGTPKLLLHTLMNTFNSNDSIPIKIIWGDKNEIYEKKVEQEIETTDSSGNTKKSTKMVTQEVSISLGGEDAKTNGKWNYAKRRYDNPKLYKSISSLFNSFCSQCAPIEETGEAKTYTVKNSDGEDTTITSDSYKQTRTMTWKVIGKYHEDVVDPENKKSTINREVIYVAFFYNKPSKYNYIRKYDFGPMINEATAVKSLTVENNTEFAMLSAIKSFEAKSKAVSVNDMKNRKTAKAENITYENTLVNKLDDERETEFDDAYENCIYKGTMTIMGDPSYMFGNVLKPYAYPIYLNIKIPSSSTYGDFSFDENNYTTYYATGFYVITSIRHEITTSGYYTTLGIMKYPGIEKDIF